MFTLRSSGLEAFLAWDSQHLSNLVMQDDSRALASMLFPELSPLLKRKKDHGKLIFFFDHGKDSEAIASLYFNI